jgi:hypothetical protein
MLTLPELLRLPNVDNGLPFSISPDERQIVFSWNKGELGVCLGLQEQALQLKQEAFDSKS